jgi:hypothetical protein
VVSPVDAPLELAPKPFNGVYVNISDRILFNGMVYPLMFISGFSDGIICSELIGHHSGTRLDVILNDRNNRRGFGVIDNMSNDFSFSLDKSENWSFTFGSATALSLRFAADICFVGFNNIFQYCPDLSKKGSDLFCHSPSTLISYTKLSFQFFSRNSIFGVGKKVDSEEPILKRSIRFMKNGICQRMNLISTKLTSIAFAIGHFIKFGFLFTGRAICKSFVSIYKYFMKASVIIRVFLIELFNSKLLYFHGILLIYKYDTI